MANSFLATKITTGQIFTEKGDMLVVTRLHTKELKADQVKVGTKVKVTGTAKGKGFQGVVRRHGFKGVAGRTHGQSDRQRHPGSIGMRTTPGRVWKGHRMAGRMGGQTVSIRNLKIIGLDEKAQILTVSGTVPGPRYAKITITTYA